LPDCPFCENEMVLDVAFVVDEEHSHEVYVCKGCGFLATFKAQLTKRE